MSADLVCKLEARGSTAYIVLGGSEAGCAGHEKAAAKAKIAYDECGAAGLTISHVGNQATFELSLYEQHPPTVC
jgi:hypothetical protein